MPEIERQQAQGKEAAFRGDTAFAKPELYEALEERNVRYESRFPAKDNLQRNITLLLQSAGACASLRQDFKVENSGGSDETLSQQDRSAMYRNSRVVVPGNRLREKEPTSDNPFRSAGQTSSSAFASINCRQIC